MPWEREIASTRGSCTNLCAALICTLASPLAIALVHFLRQGVGGQKRSAIGSIARSSSRDFRTGLLRRNLQQQMLLEVGLQLGNLIPARLYCPEICSFGVVGDMVGPRL